METIQKPVSQLSTAELEALLKQSQEADRKKLEKEKAEYEKNRDKAVMTMFATANALFTELKEFKTFCHIEMDKQGVKLSEYGKIKSTSKGGFQLTNSDDTMRIVRRRDTEPSWDERSVKAVELIKDFLGDTIKKKNIKLYEILIGFLQKNAKGDLEYSSVMNLYSHEDKYDDPRWKEGLRLIKESFSNHFKGFGYEFKFKNEQGKWESIVLNFSSL